jgi:3-polyprenyl-4-hydroxybenzoate decarboxylase
MLDMNGFLKTHGSEITWIKKPVKLDHVGALIAQAANTIVFENISGYPGFRLADQFFVSRKAQARVLGCEPKQVVKRLAEVIRKGPRPLKEVQGAPCQEKTFVGEMSTYPCCPLSAIRIWTPIRIPPVLPFTAILRPEGSMPCSRDAGFSAAMRWSPPL